MSKSNIEWTEITWNPTTGCTKISDGCVNCYAETIKIICERYHVPFFFKQWGVFSFNENPNDPTMNKHNENYAKGGCELNGIIYHQMPELITSNSNV